MLADARQGLASTGVEVGSYLALAFLANSAASVSDPSLLSCLGIGRGSRADKDISAPASGSQRIGSLRARTNPCAGSGLERSC